MERKHLIAAVAVIAVLCIVGASYSMMVGNDKDTLIVETSPNFAPFDYRIGDEYVGIDMDIVRAVCEDMGCDVEFRTNTFDSILLSVPSGKADIGASGFSISAERAESVNFSHPYATITQVIVAPIDTDIRTFEDVKGKRISVQTGTTGADYAETVSGNVIFQKTYADVIMDLLSGKADCEVVDSTVAIAQVSAHPDELQVLDILEDSPEETYGFIFSKSNTELLERFNASFEKVMESGLYDEIWNHYESNGFSPDTPSFFSYKGTLTVVTGLGNPPFDYMHGTESAGMDLDILKAICHDMNYRLVINSSDPGSIVMSVQQGESDIGAYGFVIDDDVGGKVLFSDPYVGIGQVVVVKKDSPISNLDDIRGQRISVQAGTVGADCAWEHSSDVVSHKTYAEAVADVLSGSSACGIMDSTIAEAQVARNPDLKVLDILGEPMQYYGFVLADGNQELRDTINASLERLVADGTVGKIVAYYSENDYLEVPSYYSSHELGGEDEPTGGEGFWSDIWATIYKDFIKNDRYNYIFEGLKNTLIIAALALLMGMGLGTVVAMVRSTHDLTGRFRLINGVCKVYTTVIRGTPVMVQLLIIYYVIFASSELNSVLVASVAFGLNSGAYVAEVVRSGINAVPKGQMEACRSLGMSSRMAMTTVILPQAVKNILPALGNEGISLLKETSVAGYIGVMDLTRGADIIRGQTYDALFPMIVAAAIYLSIVLVMTRLIGKLEKRLNNAY